MHHCKKELGCSGNEISTYSKDEELGFDLCNECGIIWRSADSINYFKSYEQDYFDLKKYNKKRKHKVKKSGWLIDLANIVNPGISSILDVGCSIGCVLEAAKNKKIEHLGIDISEYAVNVCTNLHLNASNYSLEELIAFGNKYDLIVMQHVLEHFKNPFLTLQLCNKLLRKSGVLIILVPNSKYRNAVKFNSKHRFYSKSGVGSEHYVYFNYSNLSRVVHFSGYKVKQENYPIFIRQNDSLEFFINRVFRRLMSVLEIDQELLLIAQKM